MPPDQECEYWAHSNNRAGEPQSILKHLLRTSWLAQGFARAFGGEEHARWAGLWHDVGKCSAEFQSYLRGEKRRGADHKLAGALLAMRYAQLTALALDGHHGGLPSQSEFKTRVKDAPLVRAAEQAIALAERYAPSLQRCPPIPSPAWLHSPKQCELFIRMLYSALVDADFLDTESHFYPERTEQRQSTPSIEELWSRFEHHQAAFSGRSLTTLNRIRHEIYGRCIEAASQRPGVFRLTVPTGGGKTLSAMGFALQHALKHKLQRVIFAIPFTSIIEQTADVYRSIFGKDAVLEHHSAIAIDERKDFEPGQAERHRLACENWNFPIIVTTNVQLFESLFAHKPSRCRKLHNIAESVLILDEVQALPTGLLQPILDVLKELVAHYKVTVVLCSATQPAFEGQDDFLSGFDHVTDIISQPKRYFDQLKRVEYENAAASPMTWEDVAGRMRRSSQAMAIVNTKADAMALLKVLDDPDALHLSTRMCGAHRRDVLAELKRRLVEGDACRLVTTQVVEAGVDIDFPLVLRAVAPIDRIVQAAGRCNREGKPEKGQVVIFGPVEGSIPPGAYTSCTELSRELLAEADFDLHDPDCYTRYFRRVWQQVDVAGRQVQDARKALDFPRVAETFRMIKDDCVPVAVRYAPQREQVDSILAQLRSGSYNSRALIHHLQPYLVNVRKYFVTRLERDGVIAVVIPGLYEWQRKYDERLGIVDDQRDPEEFIV